VQLVLREDALCFGAKDCQLARKGNKWRCMACTTLDESDAFKNGDNPEDNVFGCSNCGSSTAWQLERCDTCPRNQVVKMRMESPQWPVLVRALDLEKLTTDFSVNWSDVDAKEAEALQILKQERARLQSEQFKKQQEQMNGR
jgi:hypothetical protein